MGRVPYHKQCAVAGNNANRGARSTAAPGGVGNTWQAVRRSFVNAGNLGKRDGLDIRVNEAYSRGRKCLGAQKKSFVRLPHPF